MLGLPKVWTPELRKECPGIRKKKASHCLAREIGMRRNHLELKRGAVGGKRGENLYFDLGVAESAFYEEKSPGQMEGLCEQKEGEQGQVGDCLEERTPWCV